MPLTFTPRQRTSEDKIVYFTSPVNLPTLNLGDFTVQTNTSGALTVQPKDQVIIQPAFIAKPVSISTDISGLFLIDSAETGGRVVLKDLLNKLLDIPIYSLNGVEMPLRSLFGQLFARAVASEAVISDLSGVRIPAVLNEVVNNASLDESRALAQALKDAAQDASGALLELASATASADITAIAGRVTALEGLPAVDLTTVNSRLDAAEGAIVMKADLTYVDAGLLAKANQAEFTVVADRVTALEGGNGSVGTRLDAVEAGVASKVAQADYDVYVAANDAAVAAKADAADLAGKADASAVALKEDIGRIHKVDMVLTDVSGVNAAYWASTLDATIGAIVSVGKVAEFINGDITSHFCSAADSAEAGTCFRFKNSGAYNWILVLGSQGGTSIEVMPGELMTVVKQAGGEWKIL